MRYVFMAILLCGTAFAGTCPSGSNYVSLTSPGTGGNAGSVTLASLGALQCYFVSATTRPFPFCRRRRILGCTLPA